MMHSKITRVLGEYGAGTGTLYLLHRALSAISGGRARVVPYVLGAQPIGAGQYANVRDDAATVVAQADARHANLSDFPRPAEVIQARWRSGAECHVARVKGQFAGIIWLARGRYEEDEVRCTYVLGAPAVSVWDFDVYVAPRYRLGRTMARLWKAVDSKLAMQGIRWSVSRISPFNAQSLAAHERLGLRRLGWVVFLVFGHWQWWASGGSNSSWRSGFGAPVIHLNPEAHPMMSVAPLVHSDP